MSLPPLPPDVPTVLVHYASGPPFRSLMELDEAQRQAVLHRGLVSWPQRFSDPTYLATRARVEAKLHDGFVAAGGRPQRQRPHYAMLGRSQRSEAERRAGKRAYLLPLASVDVDRTSFTWGDSFLLDPDHRRAVASEHPAAGMVYPLVRLAEVLARWEGSTGRPAWQEIELQLWYDPAPNSWSVVDFQTVRV